MWLYLLTAFSGFILFTIIAGNTNAPLAKDFPWQFRLAAKLRTPILMFVVVPLSFMMWLRSEAKIWYFRIFGQRAVGSHEERLNRVVDVIKAWNKDGRKRPLRTLRSNWQQMSTKLGSNKASCHLVDVSHLDHILEVDEKNMTMTCEPGVTWGEITERLLPLGYSLPVHVEMESISIGGNAMGFGMETTSHKHGFFQETVTEMELVLADGSVEKCSPTKNSELFYALPWSHGTLGFITSLTVKMVKVKPYVHVKYIPTFSPEDLRARMQSMAEDEEKAPDFLEATIYTRDKAVIQCGWYSDAPSDSSKIHGINYWFKPFYYKWVETFLEKGEAEEWIPLKHYTHRFTRSIFWELEDMIPFSNHWLYRLLWGWLGAPEVSLLKLFQGPVIRKASVYAHVVQESIMPIRFLDEGIKRFDKWYGVYPLLVFPLRVYDRGEKSGFLHPRKENLKKGKDWGIWVDLGAYGVPREIKQGNTWDAKSNIRAMEHWTRDIGGWQALYTDVFATEKEMRQMFDHSLLDKQRKRYKAEDAFPSVYTKIQPEPGIVDLSDVLAAEASQ